MPPVDSTPNINTGSFELLYSLLAYNKIPVSEYKSKETGLTVVIAEVDGPIVNGFFCLATEAFDDDGLPHTLEHLVFLGSEQFPYKGVLDLLANRSLASGTNAWTDTDHTCYTMETAGSEGFLYLMPIYLEHILYPVLSEEGFITEVHHITGTGEDAGVVYCEMQGRECSGESRLHLAMSRAMYPGKCGYSSETGGIMKNLRESTNNEKVKNFHKQFYRPENLKVIIIGKVRAEEAFQALAPLEDRIKAKGDRGPFQRPWQNPIPPVLKSADLEVIYPADEELNGMVAVAWRGPSAVNDIYTLSATSMLLKYLTDSSVSPLEQEFVQVNDPYASSVVYSMYEHAEACLYLLFQNVPKKKLPLVKPKLLEVLKKIVQTDQFDMDRLKTVIKRQKLESLTNLENNPHHVVAFMIIGHMLYGQTKQHLEQRVNPLVDLERMEKEPKSYWLSLMREYLVENHVLSIQGIPSVEEQQKMALEEKQRIEAQIASLSEQGLKEKEQLLELAVDYNDRIPPDNMLTCLPIPSVKSISFFEIERFNSTQQGSKVDLSKSSVFTFLDNVKTEFVYVFALMNTSNIPAELRPYIPLLQDAFFESSLQRGDVLIPYEEVVVQLQNDAITTLQQIGLGSAGGRRFRCGSYSNTLLALLQVEVAQFERSVHWLRELLHQTVFTVDRLKIIASKIVNEIAQAKRRGDNVVSYVMKVLTYIKDSNPQQTGILAQQKFLTELLKKLDSDQASAVIDDINKLRAIITDPSECFLHLVLNLDNVQLSEMGRIVNYFVPEEYRKENNVTLAEQKRIITPDWKLQCPNTEGTLTNVLIGMGCLESSFFYQTTHSINNYEDPDLPAVMVYLQYLIQTEGPMWKQIRGKGLSYGYSIILKPNEGLLYLTFSKSTNVVAAYKEALDIVERQISKQEWDEILLESAKSSLLYEIISEEKTIGSVVDYALMTIFYDVDYTYNRKLLSLIENVNIDDLNRVGSKYISPLFDSKCVKTAVVCDAAKAHEIAAGFESLKLPLTVFPSIEESFLNE